MCTRIKQLTDAKLSSSLSINRNTLQSFQLFQNTSLEVQPLDKTPVSISTRQNTSLEVRPLDTTPVPISTRQNTSLEVQPLDTTPVPIFS
jgi:hypothetical protein